MGAGHEVLALILHTMSAPVGDSSHSGHTRISSASAAALAMVYSLIASEANGG